MKYLRIYKHRKGGKKYLKDNRLLKTSKIVLEKKIILND